MNANTAIRKIYQGVPDRRQMLRMFDRHAQRPNRFDDDTAALYAGEWFEISRPEHDYMFEILPPLWIRGEMFALSEFLTDRITSVFYTLSIDDRVRYFHGYCDLGVARSTVEMRDTIVERESRPVRAMTREERIEHIWSATHDEYRGYTDEHRMPEYRCKRTVLVYGKRGGTTLTLLDDLTDEQIAGKLRVHLRHLHQADAA